MSEWIDTNLSSSEMWDLEGTLEGVYMSVKHNVGRNNSNVYNIKQDDDKIIGVWGSTVLNARMEEVPLGSQVRIKFLGENKGVNAIKPYKDFSVQYKPPKVEGEPLELADDPFEE